MMDELKIFILYTLYNLYLMWVIFLLDYINVDKITNGLKILPHICEIYKLDVYRNTNAYHNETAWVESTYLLTIINCYGYSVNPMHTFYAVRKKIQNIT